MIYFGDDKMPDFCNRQHPFHYTVALNLLAEMGVDINAVNILAVGEYENYKGEVREQEPSPGTVLKGGTRIVLKIGFSGAVDNLPYQYFYGLQGKTARSDDWELMARHYMAPYDAAVIRHEAEARYLALKYSFGITDKDHLDRYLGLFDFGRDDADHSFREAVLWSSLMPFFHIWCGNAERVAEVLRLIFGYRFRIVENVRAEYEIPEEIRYRLGSRSGRLGRESIIGRSFCECDSTYQVIISGISRREAAAFAPGGANRKKLEGILNICMPNDMDFRIAFEINDRATVVGKKEEGSRLGYSTHLRKTAAGVKHGN